MLYIFLHYFGASQIDLRAFSDFCLNIEFE